MNPDGYRSFKMDMLFDRFNQIRMARCTWYIQNFIWYILSGGFYPGKSWPDSRYWSRSAKWVFRQRTDRWLVGEKKPDGDFFSECVRPKGLTWRIYACICKNHDPCRKIVLISLIIVQYQKVRVFWKVKCTCVPTLTTLKTENENEVSKILYVWKISIIFTKMPSRMSRKYHFFIQKKADLCNAYYLFLIHF